MQEPLKRTLADAVEFLHKEHVPYALIGGLAVSVRGQPRVTVDVDMVIGADVARSLQLVGALNGSPFQPLFQGVEEVLEKAFILPLRHRDTGVKVDLALGLSGFEEQALARAQPIQLAGTSINVATSEDLLIMKLLAGRPQDDQDIRGLLIAQGGRLDWNYCLTQAGELGEALGLDLIGRLTALRDELNTGSEAS